MLLKKGSKGEEVKELQKALGVGADGIFGAGTEAVVKKFQEDNGLDADGMVGNKTWEAIGIDTDSSSASEETEYTTKDGLVIDSSIFR
jgi:peptidoglycan hydrolase-like protein with peptidoglycan-binding domain